MKRIRLVLLIGFIPMFPAWLYSQLMETSAIIPTSPEAASLAKYGEIPVGNHTGVPEITIPLFSLNSNSISVPIGLKYHAGGMKVEEIASRVGLGWSLLAGGVISRTVKGLPDENVSHGGYLENPYTEADILNLGNSGASNTAAYTGVIQNTLDLEPDEFFLNTGSTASRFLIQKSDLSCFSIPHQNLDIQFYKTAPNGHFTHWIVKDDKGYTYYFGLSKDGTRSAVDFVCNDENKNGFGATFPGPPTFPSAWHLMEIEAPNGEMIRFEYTTYSSSYCMRTSASEYAVFSFTGSVAEKPDETTTWRRIDHKGQVVKRIWSSREEVIFDTKTDDREDLSAGDHLCNTNLPTNRALEFITIQTLDGTLIKKYQLLTDYFIGGLESSLELPFFCDASEKRNYRLRLKEVKDVTSSINPPPYTFTYHTEVLPDRLSFAQDHWGFFNGATTNKTLVPRWFFSTPSGSLRIFSGANRGINETFMQACALTSISYPTGGTTSFEFESHDYRASLSTAEIGGSISGTEDYLGKVSSLNATPVNDDIFIIDVANAPFIPALNDNGIFVKFVPSSTISCNYEDKTVTGCGVEIMLNNQPILSQNPDLSFTPIYAFLPNGSHTLSLSILHPGNPPQGVLETAVYQLGESGIEDAMYAKAGGLRIKSIITSDDSDPNDDLEKHFSYIEKDPVSQQWVSSGVLYQEPLYSYLIEHEKNKINEASASPPCHVVTIVGEEDGIKRIISDCQGKNQTNILETYITSFHVRNAQSQVPLTSSSGSAVEYKTVHITQGLQGKGGKEIFQYTTPKQYPDFRYHQGLDDFPRPPLTSVSWKRGLLLKHTSLSYVGDDLNGAPQYKPLQEIENEYFFHDNPNSPQHIASTGVVVNCKRRGASDLLGFCPVYDCCEDIRFYPYAILTEWFHTKKTTSRIYDQHDPTKYSETTEEFFFDNPTHALMTKSSTTSPDGTIRESRYKYPQDYELTAIMGQGSSLSIGSMVAERIMSTPIEVQQWQGNDPAALEIIGGSVTIFDNVGSPSDPIIKPSKGLVLETDAPIANWTENKNGDLYQDIIPDLPNSHYVARQEVAYDQNGLVEEVTPLPGGQPQALIWTPTSHLVQASVANGSFPNIAYTSFDVATDLDGNWEITYSGGWDEADAHTGIGRYNVSGTNEVKTTVADAGTYVLSFWTTTDNTLEDDFAISPAHTVKHDGSRVIQGWKYYELELTLAAGQEVSLKGKPSALFNWLDELRLYPVDAQMSTICYDKKLRIHSMTDANNQSVYYSYDALGRLIEVRDFEGNLIEQTEYEFFTN